MNKSSATKFGDYFKLPNPGLRAYFSLVESGNNQVYETPFAKGESTKDLLSGWFDILESVRPQWPSLWEYEIDLASKVGPMSTMKPLKDRMVDIEHYYEDILLPHEPIDASAVRATIERFGAMRGVRLRGQVTTVNSMKRSSNSGSPYFTKRRLVTQQTMPVELSDHGLDVIQTLGSNASEWYSCAVLGWRGQEGGHSKSDTKQRVVWMFPYGVNIRELQAYQPMIRAAQISESIPAWVSMDVVDKTITAMFDSIDDRQLVVCTDFSRFDQHFNRSLQDTAKTIIAAILTPQNHTTDWLENVFPIKYMIPLAYKWNHIKYGYHGMASGSGGTNFDETMVHTALQYEAALRDNATLNPYSQCLGDDGVLTYPGITVDKILETYMSHGLEMNDSKQYASSQDCIYLRRWHHKKYRVAGICRGVYSTARALGRLRYLERYYDPDVWGPRMVALRQLSIIENVKWHPLKVEFVQYCMKRDKYRLGLDIPGFLDNIIVEAMKAINFIPGFLGYTKSLQTDGESAALGIENWWVVNYLKSLR